MDFETYHASDTPRPESSQVLDWSWSGEIWHSFRTWTFGIERTATLRMMDLASSEIAGIEEQLRQSFGDTRLILKVS